MIATIQEFSCCLMLAASCFLFVGCQTSNDSLSLSQIELERIVGDANSSELDYLAAYSIMKTYDCEVTAEFWINIVNDESFDDDRRREALMMFFEHHFTKTLNEISRYQGVESWFQKDNCRSISGGTGYAPYLDRRDWVNTFHFQPDLLVFDDEDSKRYIGNGRVSFVLSEKISEEEFLQMINGQKDDRFVAVRGVYPSLRSKVFW